MKIVKAVVSRLRPKAVPTAPPGRIPPVIGGKGGFHPRSSPKPVPTAGAAVVKAPFVPRSSPKTPPAVNYGRSVGLSDYKRIPRKPKAFAAQ